MGRRPQRQPAAQQLQHRGVPTTTETARRSELEVVRIGQNNALDQNPNIEGNQHKSWKFKVQSE